MPERLTQKEIQRNSGADSSKTQRARLLRLLLDANGAWVPVPVILDLRISQFGARIYELCRLGFVIENKVERDESGMVCSWYRLVKSELQEPKSPRSDSDPRDGAGELSWGGRPRLTGLPLFDAAAESLRRRT